MSYRIDNFIDGETTESRSERFGAIFNPATGQQQGSVVLSTADECAEAIASAERAFGSGPRPRRWCGPVRAASRS
jgi:malonate-semialdehyde dehydrogenase (acetylating)/methylmalonate-semialdehyde dehydrogenase